MKGRVESRAALGVKSPGGPGLSADGHGVTQAGPAARERDIVYALR